MKTIVLTIAVLLSTNASAGMAFYVYERITGMTKQCVYNYLGNTYTITIQAHQMCPMSINV